MTATLPLQNTLHDTLYGTNRRKELANAANLSVVSVQIGRVGVNIPCQAAAITIQQRTNGATPPVAITGIYDVVIDTTALIDPAVVGNDAAQAVLMDRDYLTYTVTGNIQNRTVPISKDFTIIDYDLMGSEPELRG